MTDLRQAALQALEALEEQVRRIGPEFDDPFAYGLETDRWALMRKAIPALRAALAEPQCMCREPWALERVHREKTPCFDYVERKPQTTHWEGCEAVHPECKEKSNGS